ncbi:sporulation integral membrane protein YlbJ [Clostridium sp. CAG:1000]|jgi:sporulation integral membrane protein YlbJ|nr:sporulation integral membrane protein YlbJ [Clostridium sp. CAG:1000]
MKTIKPIFLTLTLIIFLFNLDIVINSTLSASYLFITKVFVSIFPFIILSDILFYFNYDLFLKKIFGNIISKLFNVSKSTSIIYVLSILTSHPTNSVYIKEMLDRKEIDENDINKILLTTYFPSIAFVIGTIGIGIYHSIKTGVFLYLTILIKNILIGIFLRGKNLSKEIQSIKKNNITLQEAISNSIIKGINISYTILGNIIIFTIIVNLLNNYLNINSTILSLISGMLEMTSGIFMISNLNINLSQKILLTSFILNFSGLSIIFQTTSILNKYKINIKKILIIKLIFSIIILLIFLEVV